MQSISVEIVLIVLRACFMSTDIEYQSSEMASINIIEDIKNLNLDKDSGIVLFGEKPFTGIGIKKYSDGSYAEAISYNRGKKDGKRFKWFQSGIKSYEADYTNNLLHGEVKSWWINGELRSESNYANGKPHGVQKQWYDTGALFKVMNMVNGKEEGLQKAWRKNGKLYVNYEAKNGRVFGLKRASLCYELADEKVVFND